MLLRTLLILNQLIFNSTPYSRLSSNIITINISSYVVLVETSCAIYNMTAADDACEADTGYYEINGNSLNFMCIVLTISLL